MSIEVDFLCRHPAYIPTVANWAWQFWNQAKGFTLAQIIERFSLSFDDKIPQTYLAFYQGKPAGTMSLWHHDCVQRPALYPWFAAFYIDEPYRGRQVDRALQAFAVEQLRQLGFAEAYFVTPIEHYYERKGCQYVEQVIVAHGECKRLYCVRS